MMVVMKRRDGLIARREAMGFTQEAFAHEVGTDLRTVGRWERGEATPRPDRRADLARLLKVSLSELDVLLRVEPVPSSGLPNQDEKGVEWSAPIEPVLDDLRKALFGQYVTSHAAEPNPAQERPEDLVVRIHNLYQMADYDGSARLLPPLIARVEGASATVRAGAYLAAAKLASKVGDTGLAWVTADRCRSAAMEAESPALLGIANCQIAQALLRDGRVVEAEQTAGGAVEDLARASSASEDSVSAHGALVLLLAVIAARRGEAQAAKRNLYQAADLAETLGREDNRLWTAFGPTNVAIHELSVHVALGDSRTAAQLGGSVDTDALPNVLRGRRSQVHLELAWAAAGQDDDSLAVLHLLETERVAKQVISRNTTARSLLHKLLAREHVGATPGLRALAGRAGVL
ncbi:helix-turn-helix transcriptional regulator [Kibdelosporangium lantanae]|uniref:Helix-turn-helix transcriptional regulator n=1 Tax=Kibdelosporangium lantanae TaxID=1497396 RepID=A0ABW3M0U7_9PSEU